jgi:hypothetical protein
MKFVYKAAESFSTMLRDVPMGKTHDQPSTTKGTIGFVFD